MPNTTLQPTAGASGSPPSSTVDPAPAAAELGGVRLTRIMQTVPPSFSFRIAATLRGITYYMTCPWRRVVITPESITVSGLFHRHVHRKADLVELRWNESWLAGSVVAISFVDGRPLHSLFGMHRKRRLRAALDACGYSFTSEVQGLRWGQLAAEINEDQRRYGLADSEGAA